MIEEQQLSEYIDFRFYFSSVKTWRFAVPRLEVGFVKPALANWNLNLVNREKSDIQGFRTNHEPRILHDSFDADRSIEIYQGLPAADALAIPIKIEIKIGKTNFHHVNPRKYKNKKIQNKAI